MNKLNKEQHKKLTFDDILARKMQREKDKMKVMSIYIPSMDGELIFNSLPEHKLLSILDGISGDNRVEDINMEREFIYSSCKDLQNPELHEILGVIDPIDVVREVFTLQETDDIAKELLKFNGIGTDENKIVANIKN